MLRKCQNSDGEFYITWLTCSLCAVWPIHNANATEMDLRHGGRRPERRSANFLWSLSTHLAHSLGHPQSPCIFRRRRTWCERKSLQTNQRSPTENRLVHTQLAFPLQIRLSCYRGQAIGESSNELMIPKRPKLAQSGMCVDIKELSNFSKGKLSSNHLFNH